MQAITARPRGWRQRQRAAERLGVTRVVGKQLIGFGHGLVLPIVFALYPRRHRLGPAAAAVAFHAAAAVPFHMPAASPGRPRSQR